MIICPNCGKENQDHYKFCLACGTKLPPRSASSPRPSSGGRRPPPPPSLGVTPPTLGRSPSKTPTSEARHSAAPPPGLNIPTISKKPAPQGPGATMLPGEKSGAPPAASAPVNCESCGQVNPPGFRFCGRCGGRLAAAAAAPAPAPAPAPEPPRAVAPPTPATPPPPEPAPEVQYKARLTLLREDGSEGGSLDIEGGPHVFGRQYGPPFDQDYYLNPEHCAFTVKKDGLFIEDRSDINGVYRKIEGKFELQDRDMFRVGQELLFYEDLPEPTPTPSGTERMGSPNPGYWGRVSVMIDGLRIVEGHPFADDTFNIGREQGDLTFPMDGYVSSAHCRIFGDDSGVFLEDLGSSNGTYLRIRSGTLVDSGTLILVGQQLFRIDRIP